MIINNLIIGKDVYGHKLQCGDVCSFKVNLKREEYEEKIERMRGMIIYDEDSYSFAFETLDEFAPLLLMKCAEPRSVEKLYESNRNNFDNMPDGDKWKEIYNNNLMTIK